MDFGFLKAAAATPLVKTANPELNAAEIIKCMEEADKEGAGLLVFPELCLTGYTCGDLFFQPFLYEKQMEALKRIVKASKKNRMLIAVGCYLRIENRMYNCAVMVQDGAIVGAVPKLFIPADGEHEEERWFAPGTEIAGARTEIRLLDETVPFGFLLFRDEERNICIGTEVCRDLWVPVNQGAQLSMAGAHIVCNLSANLEIAGKAAVRRDLIKQASASSLCAYVYANAGVGESTADVVFSGHSVIAENGAVLKESPRFLRSSNLIYADIDVEALRNRRAVTADFDHCANYYGDKDLYREVSLKKLPRAEEKNFTRHYSKLPFLPENPEERAEACRDVFSIQTAALAGRLERAHAKKAVIGISGGLDSTLALLVTAGAFRLLGRKTEDIVALTMPGFGTTDQTYNNALTIMRLLGTEVREIPIGEAVLQHFKDIGHDPEVKDAAYENAQARERTQILMDIANKEGGVVVGTGDLSEEALGWCTYNGDHMSMYAVNADVPKTQLQYIIRWVMAHRLSGEEADEKFSSDNALLKKTLQDILDTPISPELLPPDKDGKIAQKTENAVGPYILHDFFLFHTVRYQVGPGKLLFLASQAFAGDYEEEEIRKWLRLFYRRFFTQQFKRSCSPDGPKVNAVDLSPRGGWHVPSDADGSLWISDLDRDEN